MVRSRRRRVPGWGRWVLLFATAAAVGWLLGQEAPLSERMQELYTGPRAI